EFLAGTLEDGGKMIAPLLVGTASLAISPFQHSVKFLKQRSDGSHVGPERLACHLHVNRRGMSVNALRIKTAGQSTIPVAPCCQPTTPRGQELRFERRCCQGGRVLASNHNTVSDQFQPLEGNDAVGLGSK